MLRIQPIQDKQILEISTKEGAWFIKINERLNFSKTTLNLQLQVLSS